MNLRFAFWPVRADLVRANLERFTRESGIHVEPIQVDQDYATAVWHTSPDVLYVQRGEASLWWHEGRLEPLDALPKALEIVQQMYPVIQQSSRSREGRLMGLTYYNAGPFCLFRHEDRVGGSRAASWSEVARESRQAGGKLLMRWFAGQHGLPWALLAQAYSEGERFVDDEGNPQFGPGTPLEKVLADWQEWWQSSLVERECLEWSSDRLAAEWASGRYVFFPNMDYEVSRYPTWTGVHPWMPGATRESVLPGHALLCIRKGADLTRAWPLVRYLGYRNAARDLFVHRRWIEELNLWVPYPALYAEAAIRRRIAGWIREEQLASFLANRESALPARVTHVPWFLEWSGMADCLIREDLLRCGTVTAGGAVQSLRKSWAALRARTQFV